ncbi:putative ATP-dependent RNA helicase ddx6 [Hamiltosporidium tvaerminnensis]|nr:putative ATP-dependent RNA helicase ddx6 [Hamiltosporidium tvaerminnensis]
MDKIIKEDTKDEKLTTVNEKEELLKNLLEKLKIAETKYGIDITEILKKDVVRTDDVTTTQFSKWEEFIKNTNLLKGIENMDYKYPSPVQAASIPYSLEGRDLIVRSKNGTGKTAAYTIPILERIDDNKMMPQCIILVPTRELALQTSKMCKKIAKYMKIEIVPIYGGIDLHDDILRLTQGVHVIVGTPGRILDIAERKIINLKLCNILVFDEADKLLSFEFKDSLDKIIKFLPVDRQILLYSATFPSSVCEFVNSYMNKPLHLNLMKELTLKGVHQFYACVEPKNKLFCLKTLLKQLNFDQCIIFCNSIQNVELLTKKTTEMGFPSYFIHSKMMQADRNLVFHNFTEGGCKILVTTDLITRGIDVPTINCVINFDFPKTTESYLHRIGRAGRFGNYGVAINLIGPSQNLRDLENALDISILPVSDKKFEDFMKKQT